MLINGQITKVGGLREGFSTNGLPYAHLTIVLAFAETLPDGNTVNECIAVDLSGEDAKGKFAQFQTITVEVVFSASFYNNKYYNNVRGCIVQPAAAPQVPPMGNEPSMFGNR